MASVVVSEVFDSIQGESTWAGLVCHFIRLAGCNLRCRYCDTAYAWEGGRETAVEALVEGAAAARGAVVEITGGEPMIQEGFVALAEGLRDRAGKPVLVETNGSRDLGAVPEGVIAIMDVKTPGSGEAASTDARNFERLRPLDEVKFVICDRADYEWARGVAEAHRLAERCRAVLFSPAHGRVTGAALGGWILADRLPVRLQAPLHRWLGLR